jgi:hypothetical protein
MVSISTFHHDILLMFQEPAQQQASNAFLAKELIGLVSSPAFNDSKAFLGYICKILDLMVTQRMYSRAPNAYDTTNMWPSF